ncbi:hypothetical protein ACWEPN_25785 [Nonomuraea wenchangensis]
MPSALDLTGLVIAANAPHTRHARAQEIIEANGHYLFVVKGNQPTHCTGSRPCPGAR